MKYNFKSEKYTDFSYAKIINDRIDFGYARFGDGEKIFERTNFGNGTVDFREP